MDLFTLCQNFVNSAIFPAFETGSYLELCSLLLSTCLTAICVVLPFTPVIAIVRGLFKW